MKSLETLGFPKEKAQTPCRNDPAIWEIRVKGKQQLFKVKFDGNRWTQSGTLSTGTTLEEVWERVEKQR